MTPSTMPSNYFLAMIRNLREHEHILLFGNLLTITPQDEATVIDYLRQEYNREKTNYPGQAPDYDPAAALWGAKIIYLTAQLIIYRKDKIEHLQHIFPLSPLDPNPTSILSADLCLRFLPHLIEQLKNIDPEDELISILEEILNQFHYSGIGYALTINNLNFESFSLNPCLKQLYTNRIITQQALNLAVHPLCNFWISSSLGIYAKTLWTNFELAPTLHEQY